MHPFSRNQFRRQRFLHAVVSTSLSITLLSSSVLAWQQGAGSAAVASRAPAALTTTEKKAAARVKLETIREVTTTLSSPAFEGRGTGQPGADRAAQYLADRFQKFGLKPAGGHGTYLQPIKFKSVQLLAESSVKIGDAALKHGEDYVILPPVTFDQMDVSGGLVFAGFGIVSRELKRDDLAGLDLKGKVIVVLGGQPDGVDGAAWKRATNPQARGMNIFGRGAAAMIVANAGTAGQPYSLIANYLSRRRVGLAS